MNRFTSACSGIALVAALALAACQNKEKTTTPAAANNSVRMGAVNDRCPISGMAVNPNTKTEAYKGDTVGFCCGMCQAKWDAMSPADKDKFIAACKTAKATTTK